MRAALLLLVAGASWAASAPTTPLATPASSSPCVFVANLHVRKCAGTYVRNLFDHDLSKQGWRESRPDPNLPSYGRDLSYHAKHLSNLAGKHWSETHFNENILAFNKGIEALRAALEPQGCKVITTLLLREPSAMMISEWEYFPRDECNTTSPSEWAPLVPNEMLRWLLPDRKYWSPGRLHALANDADAADICKDPASFAQVSDCDAVTSLLEREMAKIDHVGVTDTPESFAQWWLALGDLAGFDALDALVVPWHAEEGRERNAQRPGERSWVANNLTDAERSSIAQHNESASRVYELAKARHAAWARSMGNERRMWRKTAIELIDGAASLGLLATSDPVPQTSSRPSFDERTRRLVHAWGWREWR